MRRMLALIVAVVMTVGFATLAVAEDRQKRFEPAQRAIEKAGFKIVETREGKDFRGDEARVLKTDAKVDDIVKTLLDIHKRGETLEGMKVVGLAHLVHNDTWNVTFREGEFVTVVKVSAAGEGAEFTVRLTRTVPTPDDN